MAKRVYRSTKNRMLLGVCGGLGEYWNMDPTLVRLLYVIFTLVTGFLVGLIVYVVAALIIPEK